MSGKHVEWRIIAAFPDYEVNPLGDVRTKSTHEKERPFRHHGAWAYTLTRFTEHLGESWVVTKNGLIEVTFPDRKERKISSPRES